MAETQGESTEVRRKRAARSLGWWALACLMLGALAYLVAVSGG